MRIAITGAHGVGKSTLIKEVLEFLNGEKYPTKEDLMKLAITGAHGTGKSTLSKLASGKLDYRFIPEAAFEAYQAGFKLNETTGMAAEMWILSRQIEQEMRAGQNWVSDRCLVDTLAYAKHFFSGNWKMLDLMAEIALPYIRQYDHVLYLPTGEFPIEDDGHRSTDPEFQRAVDETLRRTLVFYKIPHHCIKGTVEERMQQVREIVRGA